ncbi:NADH-quinone oxidoreductase subunit L [bacterium]|nr:NADH-quinone oxidoreductase subunit L [bacterium]
MLEWIWLIPVLPAIGAFINGILGQRFPKTLIHWIACGTVGLSFLLSVLCVAELSGLEPKVFETTVYNWIPGGSVEKTLGPGAGEQAELNIPLGFLLDPLSAVMILIVTGVGFLIHIYSIGYMWHEDGYYRFFTYMNLFMFSMLLLVLGSSFLTMFVGWEGVGLCSYLLIGFYYKRQSAADAGKKAFIVNRIGDFGFILGVLAIFSVFGTLEFTKVMSAAPQVFRPGDALVMLITLALFVGATGKSAQIPLYTWLPDAMEGPTPVSALIHAATMVTAGVYMIARCNALFSLAPDTLLIVATIGAVTAIFAASIGLVQRDIKRVLAYSTVSQLGYMFLAMGVGAYAVGIFHLTTHAFFKALLFLGSGSVIHAMSGEQDLLKMGDLRKRIPTTFKTMLVGTIAIAGIPPLAGFFSKDEILWQAFSSEHGSKVFWILGTVAAAMTAFYMFRLLYLAFYGKPRMDHHTMEHIHESPRSMTIPLIILAALSIVGGWMGIPKVLHIPSMPVDLYHWLEPVTGSIHAEGTEVSHGLEIALMAGSVVVALAGIGLAYMMYLRRPEVAEKMAATYPGLHRLLFRKYYVDEIYNAVIIQPMKTLCLFFAAFDLKVIDGIVNGSAWATLRTSIASIWFDINFVDLAVNLVGAIVRYFGGLVRKMQTGVVQNYGLISLYGFFVLLAVYMFFYAK